MVRLLSKDPGTRPLPYTAQAPGCAERIFAHLRARGIQFERDGELFP